MLGRELWQWKSDFETALLIGNEEEIGLCCCVLAAFDNEDELVPGMAEAAVDYVLRFGGFVETAHALVSPSEFGGGEAACLERWINLRNIAEYALDRFENTLDDQLLDYARSELWEADEILLENRNLVHFAYRLLKDPPHPTIQRWEGMLRHIGRALICQKILV